MRGLIPPSALSALRSASESTMRDQCVITRKSPDARTLDPVTGDYNDPTPLTIYSGECRVRHLMSGTNDRENAGENIALGQYEATLPRSVADIIEGDVLTVTASDDIQLIGRPLYVLVTRFSAENVHRRIPLQDRQ